MNDFYTFLIYMITFLLSFLLYRFLRYYVIKKSIVGIKKYLLLFLSTIPIIILFSFRNNVGTDYSTYYSYYNTFGKITLTYETVFDSFIEPIWILIFNLFYNFKIPFWGVLVLFSSCFCWFQILILEKYNDKNSNFICQFLIYICLFSLFMNTTRQQLACIVILYASFFLLEKKYVKFFLLIFLASLFHYSALFLLILPIVLVISKNKILSKLYYIVILTSPFWAFLLGDVLNFILKFLDSNSVYLNVGGELKLGYLLYTLPNIMILIYLYFHNKKEKNTLFDKNSSFFLNTYLLNIFCQSAGSFFLPIERLGLYFSAFQILLFSTLVKNISKKTFLTTILILWYLIYYIIMFAILKANEIYPYHFIWSL